MSEHRLIYADELYDTLANKLTWLMRYGDSVYLEVGEDIREAINEQSTAYDIDNVVEQLECYLTGWVPIETIYEAIEMVKGGGIDG